MSTDDDIHPGGLPGHRIDIPRASLLPQPSPPTFNPPADRYVTPGSCHAMGHVFVWSENTREWHCPGCGNGDGGRRGRPMRPQPLPPVHPDFQPVHVQLPPVTLPWTIAPGEGV